MVYFLEERNDTNVTNITNITIGNDNTKCEMFGLFGYMVQIILGVLSFMILISKVIFLIISKQ